MVVDALTDDLYRYAANAQKVVPDTVRMKCVALAALLLTISNRRFQPYVIL